MNELQNPVPRESSLPRGVSVFSSAGVPAAAAEGQCGDMLAHRSTGLRSLQSGKGQPEHTAKEDDRPVSL